jgi:hypothetical protein
VRDVALACGKEVGIEMEGKETELDKTIIEAIKDPLTHLVRNSVGLVVERILDILEDRADVRSVATRSAVLYSAVIADRVTELLNIPAILRSVDVSKVQAGPAARAAEAVN